MTRQPGNDRLLIVGWDGADWEIVDDLMARGDLPFVDEMSRTGIRAELASARPAHSWAAWPTFLTGLHPAGHGVFDFIEHNPRDPQRRVPATSGTIRAPSFLEILSDAGIEVRSANVPLTYPPIAVRGRLVAGGVIPPGRTFVVPKEWADELEARAPFPPNGMAWTRFRADPDGLLDEVEAITDARTRSLEVLLEGQWSVAVCVYVAPDRIQHPFGRYLLPTHPEFPKRSGTAIAERLRSIFRRLDTHLSRLADATGAGTTVVLMSDHGFRPLTHVANLDRILIELGYLQSTASGRASARVRRASATRALVRTNLGRAMRRRLRAPSVVSWSRSRAYTPASGAGVSVNLAGREPGGTVQPADYERVRETIRDDLLAYRDPGTGEHPFAAVLRREDLPAGPHAGLAPDLLPVSSPLWSLGHADGVSAPSEWPSGTHRNAGILVAAGGRVSPGPVEGGAFLGDLAPTALAFCGVASPPVDGRPIAAIAGRSATERTSDAALPARGRSVVTDEDADLMSEHLRDLGYIE